MGLQRPRKAARIMAIAWAPWPIATGMLGGVGRVMSPAAHTAGALVASRSSTATKPSASQRTGPRHHSLFGTTPPLMTNPSP